MADRENDGVLDELIVEANNQCDAANMKTLRHKAVHGICMQVLLDDGAIIETAPAHGALTPPGPSHTPTPYEIECEAHLMIADLSAMTPVQRRDFAIGVLDGDRRQYETAKFRRPLSMMFARECGLSCHDIGAVLGITGEAVRQAIKRAEGSI